MVIPIHYTLIAFALSGVSFDFTRRNNRSSFRSHRPEAVSLRKDERKLAKSAVEVRA
jgi:hypothetical protein